MKKQILFGGMLLMAATFTACNEDFEDWAAPQANGPEEAIVIPGFTAAAVSTQDLATTADEVPTFTLSTTQLPEGFELGNARIDLTPVGIDDAEKVTVNTSIEGMASKETLQEIVENAFGKRPTARTFNGHVLVDAINNGQAVYIDAGNIEVSLIPKAPQISQNYYIVGGTLDWATSASTKELKFSHSDADVYDDPVFSIVIDAAEGDTWFAIGDDEACDAVGDGDWSKLFGTTKGNGANEFEGKLDRRYNLSDDGSFCVPAGSKLIKVVIDMMEYTYTITPVNIAHDYYLVGGPLDWAASAASKEQKFSHSDKDVVEDPVFTYVLEGTGSETWFAIGDDEACDAIANGDWTKLYGTTAGNGNSGESGSLARRSALSDDGSFKVDGTAKYYRIQINMAELTYTVTALNFEPFIYFIGATDGWANAEQKLALTDESGIYTGYVYCADPNGWGNEFKFQRVPGSWDNEINSGTFSGGISGDFADGGGNIKANAGEGVYFVTADMANQTLTATKIDYMGVTGDFCGWNEGAQMTWNATDYCFELTNAGVTAAGWKFRANGLTDATWAVNLGGDSLGDLVQNGNNLSAEGSTIKLYPTRKSSDKIFCTVE